MMSVQKFAWTAVFGSIVVGTAIGMLALVGGGNNAIGPAVGCAVFTAIAAGAILIFARIATSDDWRLFGLFAICWTLLQLFLALIIMVGAGWRSWFGEEVAETCGALFLTGPPVILAMRFWIVAPHRVAARIAVGACALSLLIWVMAAMFDADYRTAEKLRGTAVLVEALGCCMAFGFAGIGIGSTHWRVLRAASLISTVAALVLGRSGIWQNNVEFLWSFWATATIALWLGHFNLMRLCPLTATERFLRWIAVVAVAVVGLLVNLAVRRSAMNLAQSQDMWSLTVGVAILAAAATLGVIILSIRSVAHKPLPVHPAAYLTLDVHVSELPGPPEAADGGKRLRPVRYAFPSSGD